MRCSAPRSGPPIIGCLSKVGPTHCASSIQANASTPSGIISAMPMDAMRGCASITCFLILRLHRACGLPASIDTCAVGKRRAITHRHGLSLPTNDDSTNDSFAPDPDRFFALAAIGYESFLAYRCVNRFWCIWGFWAGAGSLADRRPTGREAQMPYFKPFPVTDESDRRASAADHGLLSADAPEPYSDQVDSFSQALLWFKRQTVRDPPPPGMFVSYDIRVAREQL